MTAELLRLQQQLDQTAESCATFFAELPPEVRLNLNNAITIILAPEMNGPAVMCNTTAKALMCLAKLGLQHAVYVAAHRKETGS